MTVPLTWVIGAGGLLGSSTVDAVARRGPVWSPEEAIGWAGSDVHLQLTRSTRDFLVAADGRPWQIAWCAGASTTSTTWGGVRQETELFDSFLHSLESHIAGNRDGALFVASSVGGVYAGSDGAPFSESSVTAPVSPYGHAKMRLEKAAIQWSRQAGVAVVIGRISNLYGPGQNLAKSQGLISRLCRAYLSCQPTSIYVPLGTLRDYIFASDCGALVSDLMIRLRHEVVLTGETAHVKILASHQSVTLGSVIAELRRIMKRPPKIVYGTSPSSRFQAHDLRVRSEIWPELDKRSLTPLPAGMNQTIDGLTRMMQAGRLV